MTCALIEVRLKVERLIVSTSLLVPRHRYPFLIAHTIRLQDGRHSRPQMVGYQASRPSRCIRSALR